jgi:hypothetical protein
MASRVSHQDIVRRLLETKAVDFAAIGKAVEELGPSLSIADEGWEGICGTMRHFCILYILNPRGPVVENEGESLSG